MNNTKKIFFNELKKHICQDDYFLTADLGFGMLDDIREMLGDHFINVGASEQAMISIASGIGLSGHRVFTYTITPFYLRALEQIKLDIFHQKVDNVILIGGGTPKYKYENYGPSHDIKDYEVKLLSKYLKTIDLSDTTEMDVRKILNFNQLILLPR